MDTKSLTYAELGEALGITAASAKRLSNRRKWAKVQGNDGLARVIVPVERLNAPRPAPGGNPSNEPGAASGDDPRGAPGDDPEDAPEGVSGDARALIAVLESRVSELQGHLAERDSELRDLRSKAARVEALEVRLETEKHRAEEVLALQLQRLEEIRQERDRWHAAATERRSWWPWRRTA